MAQKPKRNTRSATNKKKSSKVAFGGKGQKKERKARG